MTGIVARVESDVVSTQHPAQKLGPRRENPVDLRRRKRDVEEESDREVRPESPKETRNERKVEVVNPDPGPRRADGGNRLGEALVHGGVDVPRLACEVHAVDEVVEERPERLVADPAVESLLLGLAQQHRGAAVLDSEPCNLLLGLRWNHHPGPSHPHCILLGALQGRHKPTRARLEAELVVVECKREREPVACDYKIAACFGRRVRAHVSVLPPTAVA